MFNYLKTNITQAANTAAEKIKTVVENVDTSQFNLDNLQNLRQFFYIPLLRLEFFLIENSHNFQILVQEL